MDPKVAVMAVMRMLFGVVSLTGGLLMFRFNDLQHAVRINGVIGSIGPFVFLLVSMIGLAGLAAEIDYRKLAVLVLGVVLIMLGTR